jgi:uncharacterized damage-inducible protein DinB
MSQDSLVVEITSACTPEIGRWLWALEDTRQRTKDSLQGLTQAVLDWNATGGNSVGTLLYHIAAIEADWLYSDVLETPFPPGVEALFPYDVRDEQGLLAAVYDVGLEDHLGRLDLIREKVCAAFRDMAVEEFRRVRHLADYDVTPEWVLHHLIQHEAEHRGQIGELRVQAERAMSHRERA